MIYLTLISISNPKLLFFDKTCLFIIPLWSPLIKIYIDWKNPMNKVIKNIIKKEGKDIDEFILGTFKFN